PARVVWELVGRWDLGKFLAAVAARGEAPGRAADRPAAADQPLALRLHPGGRRRRPGTGPAVRVARRLPVARRRRRRRRELSHAQRFSRGARRGAALDDLLTRMIAALTSQGLATVTRISQD